MKLNQSSPLESLRVAIVTTKQGQVVKGGAEQHFQGLLQGCRNLGCQVDMIEVDVSESTFDEILSNHNRCSSLNLARYDIVISTKVPTYAIKHPAHIVNLIHTVRVFDDMFYENFPSITEELFKQRSLLHRLELEPLAQAKARFANGRETANRLYRWRGLHADVIHPPLLSNRFCQGPTGDYFFIPGRLHSWKRIDLLIQAVLASEMPLQLKIAGCGEEEQNLKKLAKSDPRITFLGSITDDELINLYANALAIPFVPIREDFGYITLEAFASGKPVITCTDSGEPTRLVKHAVNGIICFPDPQNIRLAMETLFADPQKASAMGEEGLKQSQQMNSWTDVARTLIEAACAPGPHKYNLTHKICVLDMQPVMPPVGGGRLRLLGLYHNLGSANPCVYVGTYDWPGESYRCLQLSETLQEKTIPLSDAHHQAALKLSRQAAGKGVIDIAFSMQAILSPDYLQAARQELLDADVVIFSHPWVYPLVKDSLRPGQIVVYDSHNVEGILRSQLLDAENLIEAKLLRKVVEDENSLGWAADWILACSHEDLLHFHHCYGFPLGKMRVVPNGVMAFNLQPATSKQRLEIRRNLGIALDAFLCIFIGSPYGPNVAAAEFILDRLALTMPQITFVIAGGVGELLNSNLKNVIITGNLSEEKKQAWLRAADIGLNPMFSGSGTNIKMFDFMSAGLPVVSTSIGARGIVLGSRNAILIVESSADEFVQAIDNLSKHQSVLLKMGQEARMCVEEGYAWERISEQLGCFLSSRSQMAGQSQPLFSVVVPTLDRHQKLSQLMRFLQRQIERDFEVVVVDQTSDPWSQQSDDFGFPLVTFQSAVRGAVRARNTGAMIAQGQIIAFVDDDCEPDENWLLNARPYFNNPDVVGIEGMITSSGFNNPSLRSVTNVNFEGFGFMTANLFVRSDAFQFIGGFDLQFDHPHFREDTDLGWRLLQIGMVPYGNDVRVFHPPQSRSDIRESLEERDRYFQKDALLYQKHPDLYRQLFFAENHYQNKPGFRENLLKGFQNHRIEPPQWMLDALAQFKLE